MRILSVTLLAVLLTACVTPQVFTPPGGTVNFKQYKMVKLVVINGVNTPYSKEGIPMFEGLLKGKLQSLGYSIVDGKEDMMIEVTVTAFDPGDRALRTFIGFGAGKAVLTYFASFKDISGMVITELRSGTTYHGLELVDNPLFKSDEGIRMGMIQDSVIQIGKFIQNNGILE